MKVPYSWLKDYLDVKLTPEKAAHLLTMAGAEVTATEKADGDVVFELEITPNRADCLSIIGIARELAAVTGKKLKIPSAPRSPSTAKTRTKRKVTIDIRNEALCPRYSGRIIEGVNVGPSPQWIQKRLAMVGLRPVNNIVDITNFCLFETGQPLHAFDYDKVRGEAVVVRRAKKGEKITTIDGVTRELTEDMLVIADAEGPIAIAGVMGSLNTEVSFSTKTLLLESAYFDPVSVRRTSRKLGLGSESSYRFERGVDRGGVVPTSHRAAALICQYGSGTLGRLVDKGKKKRSMVHIRYDVTKAGHILGVDVSRTATRSILKALGFGVAEKAHTITVTVPSFRADVAHEVDLIEEVARIYGYDNIPTTIPAMVSQLVRRTSFAAAQEKIRKCMFTGGCSEIVTYSLISKTLLDKISWEEGGIIEIANPLSAEQETMRPTLIPGMLNALLWNMNRKMHDLKFFEVGKVYARGPQGFREHVTLNVAMTGTLKGNWRQQRSVTFFDLKGIVEVLARELGVRGIRFSKGIVPRFSMSQSAGIEVDDTPIGVIGKVSRTILGRFDIKQDIFLAELDLEKLLPFVRLARRFSQISKFPSVRRDISLIIDSNTPSSAIIALIKSADPSLIVAVELFDEYYGEQIPENMKGLSFSVIYQDRAKTLTDQEADNLHTKVKNLLTTKIAARFR
jgi:phenylalanyl-tRNA synthetase beta chain